MPKISNGRTASQAPRVGIYVRVSTGSQTVENQLLVLRETFLEELKARRVGLYLHQSGIDTTTPSGQALLQMLGVFSELERSLTIERIRAGLDRARREGKTLGRPRLPETKLAEVRRLITQGKGIHSTARLVGCGVSVVQRVRAELHVV